MQLRKRAESLLARNHQADPDSTLTLDRAIEMCRFDPPDWMINCNTESDIKMKTLNAAIACVWEAVDALPDSDEKILEHCPSASRAVLRAIGQGLLEFSESFAWPPTTDRRRMSLHVWENDPDFPEVVREIAGLLNDQETFDKFCNNYGY